MRIDSTGSAPGVRGLLSLCTGLLAAGLTSVASGQVACGDSDAGSCFEANGTPACDLTDCCEAVCAGDSFCCDTEWDGICADSAVEICASCGGAAAGSCFVENGTPACATQNCCETVCASDSFCCDTEWDSICVTEAFQFCFGCGTVDAGDCCVANGTPACDDTACCQLICEQDPFCCETSWDGSCAEEAVIQCTDAAGGPLCVPPPTCPDSDHNCFTQGIPGCTDVECCEAVCADDAFCCETSWDSACVSAAIKVCNGCGDPNAGSCCEANGTPFCDDRTCCEIVCADDPFCCDTEWDGNCANAAGFLCQNCIPTCPDSDHNCFTVGGPGCIDAECCVTVCLADFFCCEVEWDLNCVAQASTVCDGCGDPDAGDCCSANTTPYCDDRTCCALVCGLEPSCCQIEWDQTCAELAAFNCDTCPIFCPDSDHNCFTEGDPGCTDEACCLTVCELDPFCCQTEWDGLCVDAAIETCDGCGDPSAGDCCSANSSPYCDDRTCCETICADDPFCCETEWDSNCAEAANAVCDVCQPSGCPDSDHGCFEEGGPGCTDVECCDAVCAIDSFCCEIEWDGVCVEEAAEVCGDCGAEEAGCCYEANGTLGCNLLDCCTTVCAIDPFCCEDQWDGICADEAIDLCCPADLNGDGEVDGADLGLLLGAWATSNAAADFNCSGNVDGADLGILLAAWGPCPTAP